MPSRAEDWLRQALRDLEHARAALRQETFEWAAFAAQQAAEKAVKAVFQSLGGDARGHSVTELLVALPPQAKPATTLIESAKETPVSQLLPIRGADGLLHARRGGAGHQGRGADH